MSYWKILLPVNCVPGIMPTNADKKQYGLFLLKRILWFQSLNEQLSLQHLPHVLVLLFQVSIFKIIADYRPQYCALYNLLQIIRHIIRVSFKAFSCNKLGWLFLVWAFMGWLPLHIKVFSFEGLLSLIDLPK